MTVFEFDGKILIVDCGVLFPEEHQPGRRPDPARLRARSATASTTSSASCSRTATKTTSARCPTCSACARTSRSSARGSRSRSSRRSSRSTASSPTRLTVKEGQHEKLGPFDLEFVAVNHSIPDALAVAIRTPAGVVLHTGDFKMDQLPLDDRITDLRAFARLGEEGVDLFLVDSTNADVPGLHRRSSARSGPCSTASSRKAPRRVIVASFSSHVHRVQQVLDAAAANGRRVALLGRSMVRNMTHRRRPRLPARCPRACSSTTRRRATCPTTRSSTCRPARRASRWPCSRRMANLDHQIEVGPGRHRHPRLQPHPGQRERGLPRHRRPDQARRERRAQGQRQGARLRSRGRGRAALLLQHPEAEERAAGARRVPAPGRERRARAGHRRAGREHDPRRERHRRSTCATASRASSASSTSASSTSTARASARSRMPTSRTAGSSARRASSRSSSSSTPRPARIITGPEIHARGFAEDDAVFDDVKPKIAAALAEAAQQRRARHARAVSRSCAAPSAAGSTRSYRRRPMIVPLVIEA